MTREALADRVVTYSDALAAFSLVNALAFLVTLADPDIRCSIARIATFIVASNLVTASAVTVCLVALRRFERRLRSELPSDDTVERFWRFAQTVRIALVWLISVGVCFGTLAARLDPACKLP